MTIGAAWIRKVKDCEELFVVSDSRLSGDGTTWDECMKINILPRKGCFISFAGSTNIAYPLMQQISMSIAAHRKSTLGFMDLHDLKGHLLNVINSLVKSIKFDDPNIIEIDLVQTEFIFGGYSWVRKKFSIWLFFYDKKQKKFVARSSYKIPNMGDCIIAGDVKYNGVKALNTLLQQKYGQDFGKEEFIGFDMEPFEMVRDLLLNNRGDFGIDKHRTIGGAPQIVKVYQHMNTEPVGVYWPNRSGVPTLLGRRLLGYENTDLIYLDPFELKAERIPITNE
ncbi:hypothetical protein IIC_04793 [Bacillus cereus VD021]|uniref:Uncharacterized protein n=1 Tax=Bacillus cereus VD021 TaxID=1053224 RepID=R8HC78_BACCE|nr:hypothetical protein [Bacillus cereus]EOO70351.1 hypothetical protein IIC_04793 [Bacillus cereus VD021]